MDAFLELPTERTAPDVARPVLEETLKRWGYSPNIVRALALRPELLQAEDVWSKALMYSGKLPRRLKEVVATTVSAVNDCDYCATSHAYAYELAGGDRKQAAACAKMDFSSFTPAEKAALAFAKKAAADMRSIQRSDVEALRAHFSPPQIVELAAVIGSFMMYNTFVTVLGLELEPANPLGRSVLAG